MYFGKYTGYLRDMKDPENRGRVRVYCPEVMGTRDDKDHWLDWALPVFPWLAHVGVGLNLVPEATKKWAAWIEFRQGDQRFPIWCGLYPLVPVDKTTAEYIATEFVRLLVGDMGLEVSGQKIKLGLAAVDKIVKGSTWWKHQEQELDDLIRALQAMAAACQGPLSPLQPGINGQIAALTAFKLGGAGEGYLSEISYTE